MREHFVVTVDGGNLRIYAEARAPAQFRPRLAVVESIDFAPELAAERPHDVPMEGHVHVRRRRPASGLPVRPRRGRRYARQIAAEINQFLQQHARGSWDFAAAPEIYEAVADQLAPDALRRLKRVWSHQVAPQEPEHLRAHFALTA